MSTFGLVSEARAAIANDAALVSLVERRGGELCVSYEDGTVLTVVRVPRVHGPLVGYVLHRNAASVWPGDPAEASVTLASIDAAALGHAWVAP